MKNYQGFIKMNESNEFALLQNLYSFYSKKYSDNELTLLTKFNEQVEQLKNSGELSSKCVIQFFEDNNISMKFGKTKSNLLMESGCGSSCACGSDYCEDDDDIKKSKKTKTKPKSKSKTARKYSGCGSGGSDTGC